MTFDELSLMAFRNDPLPRFVKLHEMAAYFGLQNIYWSYEHRFISKDQAAKRKKELQYRFEDDIGRRASMRKCPLRGFGPSVLRSAHRFFVQSAAAQNADTGSSLILH